MQLETDILNYEVSQYLPTIDLYRGRKQFPFWNKLLEYRLEQWSTTIEPWILAVEEGISI